MNLKRCLLLLAWLAIVALPGASFAETDRLAEKTQEISDRVMSPFCPGRTLSACPSDQARDLRSSISGWLEEGYSEAAVENRLEMMYGKQVFGVPEHSGIGLVGWYMPVAFLALMVAGLLLLLRKMRRGAPPSIDPTLVEEAQRRLEAEIVSNR